MITKIGILCFVLATTGMASPAQAQEYHPRRAGHPVRIVGYVLSPAGVILERLIFRPAWWLGHRGPLRSLFGFPPPKLELPSPAQPEQSGGD